MVVNSEAKDSKQMTQRDDQIYKITESGFKLMPVD